MSGRGYGNFPGNAWLAALGAGFMAFVILLIVIEPWSWRIKVNIFIFSTLVLMMVHLIAFRS